MSQTIPDRIVRDTLSPEEVDEVKSQSRHGQLALVSLVNSDGSFAGYFPLNAGISQDLTPERIDGSIVIFGAVTGG